MRKNTRILEENLHSAFQDQKHYRTRPKTTKTLGRPSKSTKNTRILEGILHLSAAGRPTGSGGTKKTLKNTTKSGKWRAQRTQNQHKMLRFTQKRPRRPRGRNSVSHSGSTAILKKTRSHARREAQKRFASGPHGSHNSAENYLKLDCRCDFFNRSQK